MVDTGHAVGSAAAAVDAELAAASSRSLRVRRPSYPAPPPAPARRSQGARVGVGVGIVARGAVAGSLTVALSGSGAGAGSPEEAVEDFAAAVSDEDVVGAITMMPPSEVGSAHELYEPLIELLVKNGELSPAGKPLAGVDIEITGLELESQQLADGVGKVYLRGGTVTVDVTASEVDPVLREGGMVEDTHEEFDLADAQQAIDDANSELGGLADEFGGGVETAPSRARSSWPSGERSLVREPTYTLAMRASPRAARPDFGAWRTRSAWRRLTSEVVESFAAAMASIDSATPPTPSSQGTDHRPRAEGRLAPGEFAALFDYLPSFQQWAADLSGQDFGATTDQATQEIADALRDVDFDITIDVDTVEHRIADDRVKVVFDHATIEVHASGTVDDAPFKLDVVAEVRDGLCADVTASGTFDGETESWDDSGCADDVFTGTDFDGLFLVTVATAAVLQPHRDARGCAPRHRERTREVGNRSAALLLFAQLAGSRSGVCACRNSRGLNVRRLRVTRAQARQHGGVDPAIVR
jgi:hypothetical protein